MRFDQLIRAYFALQYDALFKSLDLVEEVDTPPPKPIIIFNQNIQLNKSFLFLLLNFLTYNFYGTFILEYESKGVLPFEVDLLYSETLMYIQFHPRAIWPQMGVIYVMTFLDCTLIYISLMLTPAIEKRFKILHDAVDGSLTINGTKLSRQITHRILAFNRQFNRIIKMVYILFTITLMLYCYSMVLWNGNYTLSIISAVFWLFQFPIMMFYYINIVLVTLTYALIACKYVQIQQKDLLVQFNEEQSVKVVTNIAGRNIQINESLITQFPRHWYRHLMLNYRVLQIAQFTQIYSNFWRVYLTLIMGHYIAFQCYVAFMVLYLVTDLPWVRAFLSMAILEMDIQLFFFIRECAKVAKNNRKFERANERFHQQVLCQRLRRNPAVKVYHLLKAETLHIPRTLQKYGFRLMENSYITSKTFYSLISVVAIFFLMICRRKGSVAVFEETAI